MTKQSHAATPLNPWLHWFKRMQNQTTRRNLLKTGVMGGLSLMAPWASAKPKKRPNIVYILADDLGYGDISCLNEESKLNTVHIDRIANTGIKFTDAHSGSAVCTPTRYGILTGRYCWRSRLKSGVLYGWSKRLIEQGRMTVGSFLQQQGYHTACIGKWHLGMDWAGEEDNYDVTRPIKNGPNSVGFDYFFGISASLDMPPYVYIENDGITSAPDRETENKDYKGFWRKGPTGADFKHEDVLPKVTEKSVDYINQRSKTSEPFCLYVPLAAPHTPILPTHEFQDKSGTNAYGDFVLQCDHTVGQILDALSRNGITNDTLIIFTSDNGCSPRAEYNELEAVGHDPSYVFRGHKADIFEGGHRIPFIARWPGMITPGSVSDETVCLTDLLATCAAIVGEPLPSDAGEDSYSILPALLGEKPDGPIREATVHHSVNGSFSVRQGKWKLNLCPGSGGWSDPRPNKANEMNLPPVQLYDIENDAAETKNLYKKHPKVVAQLTELLEFYKQSGRSAPFMR